MSPNNGLAQYHEKVRNGEIERKPQRTPIERAKDDPKSKAKAIIAKCYDCAYDPKDKGNWKDQVRACDCTNCPLWNVRPQ